MVLFFAGCATKEEIARNRVDNTPAYRPTNVFSVPSLPNEIRRVAVLPVSSDVHADPQVMQMLMSNTLKALTHTNRFEAVPVGKLTMVQLFNRETLRSSDILPHHFFDLLKETYGADAVLFTHLSYFDPYQPVQIGLRMHLYGAHEGEQLWAFDDLLNAGDARVQSGALKYQSMQTRLSYPLNSSSTILKSPSEFSAYALNTAFSTLPPRGTTLETVTITRKDAINPTETPNPSDQPASDHPEIPSF